MLRGLHVLTTLRAAGDGCLQEPTDAAASLDPSREIVCVGADMMHKLLHLNLHENCALNVTTLALHDERARIRDCA